MKTNVTSNPMYNTVKMFLEYGMVDLIDAMKAIISYYNEGYLARDEAEEAIRRLAKIRTK